MGTDAELEVEAAPVAPPPPPPPVEQEEEDEACCFLRTGRLSILRRKGTRGATTSWPSIRLSTRRLFRRLSYRSRRRRTQSRKRERVPRWAASSKRRHKAKYWS